MKERFDPLYKVAVDAAAREEHISIQWLQRTLGIGYGRASIFMRWMENDNLVSSTVGSQGRKVLTQSPHLKPHT